MDRLARDITTRGWAAWNVEYRRVGIAGGGGGFPETFDDALRALRHIENLEGVDTSRVVTCGHSAGGHLALWAASAAGGLDRDRSPRLWGLAAGTRSIAPPVAAVSLAGVVDLVGAERQSLGHGAVVHLMGGDASGHPDRYGEVSLIDALPLGIRQIIVHGAADTVVPPGMSEAYARTAAAAGDAVQLLLVEGADHMSVIDPLSSAWELVVEHVGRLLR